MMPIISWISARDRLGLWAGASTAAERAACVSDFISLGCGNQEGVPRKLAISRPEDRAGCSSASAHGPWRERGHTREPAGCLLCEKEPAQACVCKPQLSWKTKTITRC